jgi:hypothetical protein
VEVIERFAKTFTMVTTSLAILGYPMQKLEQAARGS